MKKKPAKYCGIYVVQKANSQKPPHFYWVARETIPKSISSTGRQTYRDHYPNINTQFSAERLAQEIAAERPKYPRGNHGKRKIKP